MTFRIVVFISLCLSVGLAWIIESGATDVFLEATRPDFQKIPLGVAGIDNSGGADSPAGRIRLGNRIEEVLKADVRRSQVFSLVDLPSIGIKVGSLGAVPDPEFKKAAEQGVSVIVWGKAGMTNDAKDPDVNMDGYVYDAGNDEMVGGKRTDPAALAWAADFYRHAGKAPLVMTREVPGFVATRLQEAVWREALHMIANGEATPEQIDIAMVNGPGPRWAFAGPCMTYHIGGGEGGMEYCLDVFGPALKFPWTRLVAPELTPELRKQLIDDALEMAKGRSFSELSTARDAGLVEVARAWKKVGKFV